MAAKAIERLRKISHGSGSGFLLIALLLTLWEASARLGWVTSSNWPPFTDVLRAGVRGLIDGELIGVVLSTLYRATLKRPETAH